MDIVGVFVAVNVYTFFAAHMTRMLRERHGVKKGFLMSNIIILGALALLLLWRRIYNL